jgi:hypothetical protein
MIRGSRGTALRVVAEPQALALRAPDAHPVLVVTADARPLTYVQAGRRPQPMVPRRQRRVGAWPGLPSGGLEKGCPRRCITLEKGRAIEPSPFPVAASVTIAWTELSPLLIET